MHNASFVGLDVGTTQIKAAAFRADGEQLALSVRGYPTYYPQPGWAEQAPEDWQRAVRGCLADLVEALGSQADRIQAIGLSAHAPSLVPVDAQGRSLLGRVPIWQDERSVPQAQSLLGEIGPDWIGLGMPFASFAAKLRWFTETHPAIAAEAASALGLKSYLALWLTGHLATDPSSEPGSTLEWEVVCRACGWSLDRLPPALPAGAILGPMRDGLHQELGLRRPVPVALGLNDGGSAVLASGAVLPGEGVISLSTNGVVFLVADHPVPAADRLARAIFCWPYLDGRWIIGGQTKAGAASLQWLARTMGAELTGGEDLECLLGEAAGSPLGSRGVGFFPYLMGQGTPRDNPLAKGAFSGLTLSTTRGDLTRAVLEGVAFALREALEELDPHVPGLDRLNLTGGGARSALWRQITSAVLARPLGHVPADSCLGAAMLAAVAVGAHPDASAAARAMARASDKTLPDPVAAERYAALYAQFLQQGMSHAAFYQSRGPKQVPGREEAWPRGKAVWRSGQVRRRCNWQVIPLGKNPWRTGRTGARDRD
jgi:xylulokinase